jgi:hypothetical protein
MKITSVNNINLFESVMEARHVVVEHVNVYLFWQDIVNYLLMINNYLVIGYIIQITYILYGIYCTSESNQKYNLYTRGFSFLIFT